jgi:SagB-type dehydrogenase family enzyme
MKDKKFVVSRFATLAWSDQKSILVSSVTHRYVELSQDKQFNLLSRFRKPLALSTLESEDRSLAKILIAGGLLVDADGREENGALQAWEPHDLNFHVLSRGPRKKEFRLRGTRAPEPLFVPRTRGELFRLTKPGAEVTGNSRPFLEVLEGRSSTREFSPNGMSLPLLSALLFYSARSRNISQDDELGDTDRRNYPSGGGRYPLEIWLVVPRRACSALRAGIYHYRPREHALERTCGFGSVAEKFLERARASAHPLAAEQGWLLLAISARIARTSWKYDSIAYSMILKEVGCLMQTVYLVAGALGLGACALGSGPLDLLPQVTGVNALLEPQVGEIVIGRPRLSQRISDQDSGWGSRETERGAVR